MKHTPGPWKIDYNGSVGHVKSISNKEDHTPTVARYDIGVNLGYRLRPYNEQKANGYLIAAAPEMLEHLKKIEIALSEYEIASIDNDEIIDIRITGKAAKAIIKTITKIIAP